MAENKSDFTQGSIVFKLLKFMIPILGSLILQAMYGAVDILVVGRFGTTAGISGVSTGSNIVNGHSKTMFVMLQGLAQTFTVRLPVSCFMSIQPNASLTMIGLAAPCATVFGIAINLICFIVLNRNTKQIPAATPSSHTD